MSNVSRLYVKWLMVAAALSMVAVVSIPVRGQSAPSAAPLGGGVVDDWSHHRLIFSNPGTEQDAITNGNYSRWWQIVNEPRYALQQAKRSSGTKTIDETSVGVDVRGANVREEPGIEEFGRLGFEPIEQRRVDRGIPEKLRPLGDLNKDWSEPLAVGQVQPDTYPAKFSFTTNTFSCTSDFVVYPTGVLGSDTKATIVAYNELYGTSGPSGTGCGARLARLSRFRRCIGPSTRALPRSQRLR